MREELKDAVRDECGYACHNVIPESDDEFIDLSKIDGLSGYKFEKVYFSDDASEALQDNYFGNGDPDVSGWQITRPSQYAILIAVSDTEDGPVAYFAFPDEKSEKVN